MQVLLVVVISSYEVDADDFFLTCVIVSLQIFMRSKPQSCSTHCCHHGHLANRCEVSQRTLHLIATNTDCMTAGHIFPKD